MKNRIYFQTILVVLIVAAMSVVSLSGCTVGLSSAPEPSKTDITGFGSYPALGIEELASMADVIVRGKVVGRGEPFELHFSERTFIVVTPVTIQVTEWIKGKQDTDTITYNEIGGETATQIMKPNSIPLPKAADVILCLRDSLDFGPDTVFVVQDDKVVVQDYQMPELDSIKEGNSSASIKADDLIAALKKALS